MNPPTNPTDAPANTFALVVMEAGAGWPSELPELDLPDLSRAVLKQEAGESHAELARRATERIASIEAAGGVLRVAVLACSGDRGPLVFTGRAVVARALLAAVRRSAGAELRFIAPEDASLGARQSFLVLAGELTAALAGSASTLSLQFPAARKRGGRAPAHGRTPRRAGTFHRRDGGVKAA